MPSRLENPEVSLARLWLTNAVCLGRIIAILYPRQRFRALVAMVVLSCLPLAPTLAASSPNYDPTCAPLGSDTCSSPVGGPWEYQYTAFCAIGGPYSTEARALQDVYTLHSSSSLCTVDVHSTGTWLVQGPTYVSKCGTGYNFASLPFRSRNTNVVTWDFKPHEVITTYSPPTCSSTGDTDFYIERVRPVTCPAPGMYGVWYGTFNIDGSDYSQWYCKGANVAKDFGDSCFPNCIVGNPINVGSGNKYQREPDYVSLANPLLRLERHYNSAGDQFSQTYRFGEEWIGNLGKHWRHTYDRRIKLVESGTFVTAFVYRQDGKLLWYNLYNDEYYTDKDVASKLERLSSGGSYTGWKFTNAADDSVEIYDVSGKLQSITSRAGVAITLAYGTDGLLSTVTDSFGRQLQFGYDSNGLLETVTDPAGGIYQYAYDSTGMLASVTYPGSTVRSYLYNESVHTGGTNLPQALTGIVDEQSQRYATFRYLSSGRASSSEHGSGAELTTISYTGDTSRTVTDALGTSRTYAITTVLGVRRTSTISPYCKGCGDASTNYDANGNVSYKLDFNGNRTNYSHDLTRNLETSRIEGLTLAGSTTPVTRTTTTAWHSTYRLPSLITGPTRTTGFTYDTAGNVLTRTITDTSVTPNVSRTWTYTYNSFGKVLTADGPRTDVSDVTTYAYHNCGTGYQCGQVNTMTDALSRVTTFNTYNAHGQPLTLTDPNGLVTTLTYDAQQRLTSRTVGTEVTGFEYWATGLLKKVTLPDSSYLLYTYDNAHRLTRIDNSAGSYLVYTLDALGNRTAEEAYDPSSVLARSQTRVFNSLNQLWKDIGAAGTPAVTTELTYDSNGNPTNTNAPLGRNIAQTHDELNRLKTITDPASGLTTYGYNALDQLISVTDPRNLTTTYTYNALGDLKQQVSPDTGTTTNTYDSGGNLKTSTDARNAITTYTYDALDRVKTAAFKIGSTTDQTITYNYDAGANGLGRLTSASDSAHSMSWSYDGQERVISKTQTVGTIARTVGYGYTNGLLTSLMTPSGQTVTYGYTHGKVTSIMVSGVSVLSNVLYEPFGPVRQWTWGNGTLAVRTFDLDGKVELIDSAGLRTYSYDDAFRITGITDATNAALSWGYSYDSLDRLTSATNASQSFGWTYDADGNRLTQTGTTSQTVTYPTTSNRLSSVAGTPNHTYTYNAAGSITGNGARTFAYNNRGRMKSTTSGSTINYTYNALGQRVRKTGTTRLFMYDEQGHLLGEYSSTGALVQETIWLGDTPVGTIRPKTGGVDVFYVHTDHLHTPRKVTRPSDNKLRWRWDATPFGTGAPNQNPSALGTFVYNLRFPGQYYDAETSLHYNYFRDYDPATGRYVQSDPIGLLGSLNTYAYVDSNPLASTDPLGLAPSTRGRSRIRNVPCNQEEQTRCRATCSAQGKTMQSCARVEKFKMTLATQPQAGGPTMESWGWVKINESCSCNEPFCDKNPAVCAAGAVGLLIGICLAPEVGVPALIGAAASQ